MTRLKTKGILAAAMAVSLTLPAWGSTIDFKKTSGGSFTSTANWNPKKVPTASDDARFKLNSAYTVMLGAAKSVSRLLIGNDKLILDMTNGGSLTAKSTTDTSFIVGLSKNDIARLTIRGGNLNTAQSIVGSSIGSNCSITVSSGGAWNSTGSLTLGSKGSGNLTITTGGIVSATALKLGATSGSSGSITISGVGSTLNLGGGGIIGSTGTSTGQLEIRSGASVRFNNSLEIRKGGTLKLSGGTLDTDSLYRTSTGKILFNSGVININDSNLAINKNGPFGASLSLTSSHTLKVDGNISIDPASVLSLNSSFLSAHELTNSGEILFKSTYTNNFNVNHLVNASGALIHGSAYLNSSVDNQGEIRALGSDLLTFANDVNNTGQINLINGGTVQFKGLLTNSGQINSSGLFSAEGGINNTGALSFNTGNSTINSDLTNGGSVSVGGNSATFTQTVQHNGSDFSVATVSVANFQKDVSGNGNFSGGGLINFLAAYNPDSNMSVPVELMTLNSRSPAVIPTESVHDAIFFDNDVVFGPAGVLNLDIFSWNDYDEVHVNGDLQLSQVNINVDPGFTSYVTDSLVLLTATNISGSLSNIHVNGLSTDQYELSLGENSLAITFISVPEPSSLLLISAMSGLLLRRRSRQTA